MKIMFSRSILYCLLASPSLVLGADSESHQKVKLCNPAETFCTDVTAGLRAKVDSDVTSSVLPTGASTSALQSTANGFLSSIDGGTPAALGQTTMSASQPVVIASDQSAVPASQSGTWTVQQGGTPTSITNAWPFKLTDGTNTTAVKAASTAAVATDPAAVVTLSPNGNQATAANQSTEITSIQILDDVPTAANGAFVKGDPIMGQLDDTSTTAATENNLMPARITAQRALHTNLRNNSGTEVGTSASPLFIDASATTFLAADAFTSKTRVVVLTSAVTLATGSCTNFFTYSGSGLFHGFNAEFNNAQVIVKLTVDGETIFDGASIATLNSLLVTGNDVARRQNGTGIVTSSATLDWSMKKPIKYSSNITICADANGGVLLSRSFSQGIVYLSKET